VPLHRFCPSPCLELLLASIDTLGSQDHRLKELSLHLWPLVNHWVKHELEPTVILEKWQQAEAAIAEVVPGDSERAAWRDAASASERGGQALDAAAGEMSTSDVGNNHGCESGGDSATGGAAGNGQTSGNSSLKRKQVKRQSQKPQFGAVDEKGRQVVPSGEQFDRLLADYAKQCEGPRCRERLEQFQLMMEGSFRGKVREHLMQQQVDEVTRGCEGVWEGPAGNVDSKELGGGCA
jgi:hypothetical protein